jgi:hypothetical protein
MRIDRRTWLKGLAGLALSVPFLRPASTLAASGPCRRVIFFYYPDGVVGPSQNGEASKWHPTGSENNFQLSPLLAPLAPYQDRSLFFRGLTMGPTDSGSHPGGAKKLLTATDHGNGESIDQLLARTAGSAAPFRHLYLGAQATAGGASGDKLISYPSAGQSITPEDDPLAAFELMFGDWMGGNEQEGESPGPQIDPIAVSVIDGVLDDMHRLRARMGNVEKTKLDLHLEALREVEDRIKKAGVGGGGPGAPTCEDPSLDGSFAGQLHAPEQFPAILRAQMDLAVLATACGMTNVAVIQAAHHTSELLMSRFEGTALHDPDFDMRSHQASHYGASHDPAKKEYAMYYAQRLWWTEQLAYLLGELDARPEGEGTMLDHSLVVMCTEVCDGNTHLHDDMPIALFGGAGGALSTGKLIDAGGRRHADLWISVAHAMGEMIPSFGDSSMGPLVS